MVAFMLSIFCNAQAAWGKARSGWAIIPGRFGRIIALALLTSMKAGAAGVLTWDECVDLAARHNPVLVAAQMTREAAEARVEAARSSFFPQMSAGLSADHRHQDNLGSASDNSYNAVLRVSQSLYDGGRNAAAVQVARSSLDRTDATGREAGAHVTYMLRTAFTDAIYVAEQVELLMAIESRRQDNAELVELRYEGGREHKGSLASSQAALFDAQIQTTQARRRAAVSRTLLWQTIGVDPPPGYNDVSGTMAVKAPLPMESSLQTLAIDTPGYLASLASREITAAQLDYARREYRPVLEATGSAGRSGDDHAFDTDVWSIGLALSIPLWTGGKTSHEIRAVQAALAEANANLDAERNSAVRSLEENRQTLINAMENVEVQERYLEAAELRGEIARQQYEDGLLSFENWSVIEDDLISKRKQLLVSRKNAMLAEAAWWQASGVSFFAKH